MSPQVWALFIFAGAVATADPLGSIASIKEFPSLTQVEFKVDEAWLQHCTGVVITNRHILSAATCFSGDLYHPTNRRVRVGTSTRGVDGQVVGVETAYNHYNFGTLGLDADITIVSLDGYLTLGENVQQAPILGQGIELPAGLVVRHAGWGTTAEGGSESSDDLYAVSLTVNSPMSCLVQYIGVQDITENMVCVGLGYTRGRDLDAADTGGALFYEDTLVGVLSFGESNADDEFPAVATAVGSYTAWIIDNAV